MKKVFLLLSTVLICFVASATVCFAAPQSPNGDFDGNGKTDKDDAIYLLYNVMFKDDYPISYDGDVNSDGTYNKDDAIYLLYFVMFKDDYPLYPKPQPIVDKNYSMDYPAGYVSNLGSNENGGITGGKPGDNNSKEWEVKKFTPTDTWKCIYRYENKDVAHLIAQFAVNAAMNDHIGYDQGERLTFWDELVKVNYNPGNITVDCSADCSSGVAAIVKCVGYRLNIQKLKDVPETMYTGNEDSVLLAAGFKKITNPEYFYESSQYVKEGDIVFRSGHTCTIVTNGTNHNNGPAYNDEKEIPYTRVEIDKGSSSKTVEELQDALNKLGYLDQYGNTLSVDGSYGSKTVFALSNFQKDYGITVSTKVVPGDATWKKIDELLDKTITVPFKVRVFGTTELNVRADAGTSYESVGYVLQGEVYTVTKEPKVDPNTGKKWYYLDEKKGWSSSSYLQILYI